MPEPTAEPLPEAIMDPVLAASSRGPSRTADGSLPEAIMDPAPVPSSLLEGLNPPQRDAVTHAGGPLLVVAGAGSGKTRVLTHRIAHLIDHRGLSPFDILAITFTNKAAAEMRERVARLVGPVAERMWVSTFHSACVRMLRRDADRLGFPSRFSIYDQADSVRLCNYVIRDLNLDPKRFPPRSVHAAISAAKNDGADPAGYAEGAANVFERRIAEVFGEYQRRLLAAGAMDFDDLLGHTTALLRTHPDVLGSWRERFAQILVDEYQDTNRVQNDLVILLSAEHRQVTVVGDADQSIYAFRGADRRNILEFEDAFPDATVVYLEQNYRSTQTILDAANAVIAQNAGRLPKELWTERGSGVQIASYHADDEIDEARYVADRLEHLHRSEQMRWGDLAVFYRTNAQSRPLEERLADRGIPYQLVGGVRFYDRREVKDAVAYLKAVAYPSDEVSVKRVLNTPKRGVGDSSVARLDDFAAAEGITFTEALRRCAEAGVSGRAAAGIGDFLAMIDEAAALDLGPAGVISRILDRSGYRAELEAQETIEAEGRLENLDELIGVAGEFDTIDELIERSALVADTDDLADDDSKVTLMTLHSAKGLEYPAVFLIGMEDGVFPHIRALSEPAELEEERRLAYVGITRAMRRLTLTHAWSRMLHGNRQYNPPSRFLKEIPSDLVEESGDDLADRSYRRRAEWGAGRSEHGAGRRSESGAGRWSGSGPDRSAESGAARPAAAGQPMDAGRVAANRERIVDGALSAGRRPGPPSPSGAEGLGLKIGDDVRHLKWGEGVITDIEGSGDEAEASVNFPSVGEKRLLLSWAPLEKI